MIYNTDTPLSVPYDLNLTELLHKTHTPLPPSHLLATDDLSNRSITLGALREHAGRTAAGFQKRLQPPDQARWMLIIPNSVEFLELAHAILWTGGVVCPVNHALKPKEIGHGIAVCRPKFVVAYGKIMAKVEEAVQVARDKLQQDGVPWERPTIISAISRSPKYQQFPDDFLEAEPLPIPHWSDTSKRAATIHLSSGTTGQPKGVCLTHRNFVANVLQLLAHDETQFHSGSKTVTFTPWAHIAMTTMPLFLGPYTGMFHHAMASYELQRFAQLVGSVKATSFQGVPSVVLSMAKSDVTERFDFSHAQVLNMGGAPLKKPDLDRLLQKAPWKIIQAYGMTEAAGYVAYQTFGEDLPVGCTGRMLPGIEARLVVEGKKDDAQKGGPGELWLRGPNITPGYANETDKGFPEKGWYNTGDVCQVDEQGRLYIVGRTKDLIKYKGFQVSPAELETYLNSHPAVQEAGVGALWDESQLTQLPTAWVVLKPAYADKSASDRQNGSKVLKEVHAWVDEQVSGYKKLRGGVWEVTKLPKNPTGKILRKEMVEMRNGLCSLEASVRARL